MNTYVTEGDKFDRLPKWAQEQIKYMQRDINTLDDSLAALRNPNPAPTRCIHDPYGDTGRTGRGKMMLDDGIAVRFVLGAIDDPDHWYIDGRVRSEYTGAPPELYLMGSNELRLRSQSSNTIGVWVER